MTTKLLKFKVDYFKSIQNSDWIETDNCSCLVGINESGKTNLLLALWKLNPANDEPIVPLDDYPRKKYVDYKSTKGEEIFISAIFEFDDETTSEIKRQFGKKYQSRKKEAFKQIQISRKYNGTYLAVFVDEEIKDIKIDDEILKYIVGLIPRFVYYSDYGNLDSEIYLPHVIDNLKRDDLGEKERAKARSLRVLFSFVKLSPKEILELGEEQGFYGERGRPSSSTIETEKERKKEREILLQSASTQLTQKFKEWWKQGNYRFRFQADGNHFRIWVSDDIRTEEVELEGRSRGLQWFFSFFLVFLVESEDNHSNCILLLDEPGISLHPIAQIDLIKFFASLSQQNQLIYTTHSPFLVNPDNLSEVKAVFVDEKGLTVVSSDLRKNEKTAEKSIYPVHAAIGLTISETLLLGCQPILVEGPSDQVYLQLIKNCLINRGEYKNNKETVFIPSGGVKGMSTVISIVSGRENNLPYVLVDGDKAGRDKEKSLKDNLYKNEKEKVISISEILGEGNFEIEDLFPQDELAKVFARKYRGKVTEDFDYLPRSNEAIIKQMEDFAEKNDYKLELGWKVELSHDFQRVFTKIIGGFDNSIIKNWQLLFDKLRVSNKLCK